MNVDEKGIWLINLYGPNQDDPYFFKIIYIHLLNLQATNYQLIMVGDYNTVLSTSLDPKGITLQTIITVSLRKSQVLWTH